MSERVPDLDWRTFFPTAFGEGRHLLPGLNRLLQPGGLDPETVRRWLKAKSDELGISATQWAKAAGLAPSTLNRFIAGNGPNNLTAATISALSEVAVDIAVRRFAFRKDKKSAVVPKARFSFDISVIAGLEAAPKLEAIEWSPEKDYKVSLPIPVHQLGATMFALEVLDDSFFGYARGAVLVCTPASIIGYEPRSNQKFIFHRREKSGYIRTSVRKLLVDPDGLLWVVRLQDDDSTPAFFLGEADARESLQYYSEDAFVSFAIVLTMQPEPWVHFE